MVVLAAIIALVIAAIWIWAIYEVITTDPYDFRYMPKPLWLLLVAVLPTVGTAMWFSFGRPRKNPALIWARMQQNSAPQAPRPPIPPAPLGIEDRADWPEISKRLVKKPEDNEKKDDTEQ